MSDESRPAMETPPTIGSVLLVDDDRAMCDMVRHGLQKRGFHADILTSGEEVFEQLQRHPVDVVVVDLHMPGISGLALCERITANYPELPVVVLTAFGSLDSAIGAIRAGSFDFISKPVEIDILAFRLERAVRHKRLQGEVDRLRDIVPSAEGGDVLIGTSAPMRRVIDLVDRLAPSDVSVLITGETGTGKELVARELHRRGNRHNGPFVAVNCAAMPEALLESELFGHVKGAFTDARATREGLFVESHGGTLFLDEVGELPAPMQPKLLRALQERVVRHLGGSAEIPFDSRIVAATNRDLELEVAQGRFREDLLYRLNVVEVGVPPLRVRGNDILRLAQHFVHHFANSTHKSVSGLSREVAERLVTYRWPGNVRELQNCIERGVALARFEELIVDDLPEKLRQYSAPNAPLSTSDGELLPLHEMEKRYILHVLEEVGGNKSTAARILELDRTTLYRKLERYQG